MAWKKRLECVLIYFGEVELCVNLGFCLKTRTWVHKYGTNHKLQKVFLKPYFRHYLPPLGYHEKETGVL